MGSVFVVCSFAVEFHRKDTISGIRPQSVKYCALNNTLVTADVSRGSLPNFDLMRAYSKASCYHFLTACRGDQERSREPKTPFLCSLSSN